METRGDGIHYRASGRPRRQNIIDEPIAPVLAHRVTLTPEAEMEGVALEDLLTRIFEQVEVPR